VTPMVVVAVAATVGGWRGADQSHGQCKAVNLMDGQQCMEPRNK
jgi:hypothetical protein